MKILVMENTKSYHQVAIDTIEAFGFEPICVDDIVDALQLLDEVDAVITDLYFRVPPCSSSRSMLDAPDELEPPAGLIVAFACAKLGKPCVVFTAGDHHSSDSWWAYGAAEGYRRCKVDYSLFPEVQTGIKSAFGSWKVAVYRLCDDFEATEDQKLKFTTLYDKYPFPE